MRKARIVLSALVVCCLVYSAGCASRGRRARRDSDMIGLGDPLYGPLDGRPDMLNIISSVEFENVLFEYDRAQIGPQERDKIEAVADYLKRNPGTAVIIEGHCDERGSREYNMALGERRALAVRAYMIGLGIDGSRIQTVSYGKEKPLAFGHDEASWRLNRRAEFILFRQ